MDKKKLDQTFGEGCYPVGCVSRVDVLGSLFAEFPFHFSFFFTVHLIFRLFIGSFFSLLQLFVSDNFKR